MEQKVNLCRPEFVYLPFAGVKAKTVPHLFFVSLFIVFKKESQDGGGCGSL